MNYYQPQQQPQRQFQQSQDALSQGPVSFIPPVASQIYQPQTPQRQLYRSDAYALAHTAAAAAAAANPYHPTFTISPAPPSHSPMAMMMNPMISPATSYLDTPRTVYRNSPATDVGNDFDYGDKENFKSPSASPVVVPNVAQRVSDVFASTSSAIASTSTYNEFATTYANTASLFPKPLPSLQNCVLPVKPLPRRAQQQQQPQQLITQQQYVIPLLQQDPSSYITQQTAYAFRRPIQYDQSISPTDAYKDLPLIEPTTSMANTVELGAYQQYATELQLDTQYPLLSDEDVLRLVGFDPVLTSRKRVKEEEIVQVVGQQQLEQEADAEGEDDRGDDGEYHDEPEAEVAPKTRSRKSSTTPPAKRIRRSSAPSTNLDDEHDDDDEDHEASTVPTLTGRPRHLKKDKQRNHHCVGCDAAFTSAFEVRRHQDDAHARLEANSIMDLPDSATLNPSKLRFFASVIQRDKEHWWVNYPELKAELESSIISGQKIKANTNLGRRLREYAEVWWLRFRCPACEKDFCRYDSRKRHESGKAKNDVCPGRPPNRF